MGYETPEVTQVTLEEYGSMSGGEISTFNGHTWVVV